MSLLKIIDNPVQDIPLVTVLRSHIGGFTDNDLVEIRLSDKHDNFYYCLQKARVNVDSKLRKKIETFLNLLEQWREEQEYLALDEFIWKIYSDTGYYNYVGLMPNGELRQANLKMLFEKAKKYETSSFKGLYNFINFIEKIKLSSKDMDSAKIIGENDDVVRIMSIHKSKGLEFPVVFLCNTSKQFNFQDMKENILLHQEMGIGVKYLDYETQIQYDTFTKEAIKSKILTETLSEEMRMLYVALTRAKEKLIITSLSKDYSKEIEKMQEQTKIYPKCGNKINPVLLKKYKRYIDWIMLVYIYENANSDLKKLITLNILSKKEVIKMVGKANEEEVDVLALLNSKNTKTDEMQEIEQILKYEYPYKLATIIPTKTSVTNIKEMKNAENKEKTIQYEEKQKTQTINFPKPKFIENQKEEIITQAHRGTLVHLCMQKLNEREDYNLEKIQNLIQDLVFKKIITEKEARSYFC